MTQKGELHWNWKGGIAEQEGYLKVYSPNHPDAGTDGHVLMHRLVMEKKLGRRLKQSELVHHKNGNKKDNREENLELVSRSHHRHLHKKDMSDRKCSKCGSHKTNLRLPRSPDSERLPIWLKAKEAGKWICTNCYSKEWRQRRKQA